MAITKTLGGDRLGAGKKIKVELHNYERSTHDLGYVWRSTMACGTLVPFMSLVALPGDNFDINLETDVKTYPTLGPLFGSFKMQIDVFQCPIRLYQKELHNNKLGVGLNMNKIRLPLMDVTTNDLDPSLKNIPLEFQQIDQSSLLAYLGVRGNGMANGNAKTGVKRSYNAIPYIAYYDIYKNYYANKQEEIGYIIHSNNFTPYFIDIQYLEAGGNLQVDWDSTNHLLSNNGGFDITTNDENANLEATDFIAILDNGKEIPLSNIYSTITQPATNRYRFENAIMNVTIIGIKFSESASNNRPQLEKFELKNIDEVREEILSTSDGVPYKINDKSKAPYNLPLQTIQDTGQSCSRSPQEGLAIKGSI
ncbi:putative VP1-1 [Microviridae sp.]|nr:putative VP1-1 [Microviridae sp.]